MKSEHFVTLFDHKFLPQGLALYESLLKHYPRAILWVLCMDDVLEDQLSELGLDNVRLLKLEDVCSRELLDLRNERTRAEFCWTLTPFSFSFVFDKDSSIERLTYLDADVYFFKSPDILFQELEQSKKDILITEHAYDYRDDRTEESGRFCVQFLTINNTVKGLKVLKVWQEQCRVSCTANDETGEIFGDQKYLNDWPELYDESVHVLEKKEEALGPWNVEYFLNWIKGNHVPVLYHFHSFRIMSDSFFLIVVGFYLKLGLRFIYKEYVSSITRQLVHMKERGMPIPIIPYPGQRFGWFYLIKRVLLRNNIIWWYRV